MEEKFDIITSFFKDTDNIFISGDVIDGVVHWTVSVDLEEFPIMVTDTYLEKALSRTIRAFYIQKALARHAL